MYQKKLTSFKAVFDGKEYTGSNYTLSNGWVVGAMPTSSCDRLTEVMGRFTL